MLKKCVGGCTQPTYNARVCLPPIYALRRLPAQDVEDVGSGVLVLDILEGPLSRSLTLGGVILGEEAVHLAGVGLELAPDVSSDRSDGSDDHDDGEDPENC